MEQNKYADDIKKIDKLEQKIAIKEASGMDASADEKEREIAMLELVEKIATTETRKTVTPAEFEAKRIVNSINKGKDSKEYCFHTLTAFEKQLQKCHDAIQSKNYESLRYNMDVLQHFGKDVYHILCSYCSENNVFQSTECENMNERYPEIEYSKDMSQNEAVAKSKHILLLFNDLITDFTDCVSLTNLGRLLTLTAILFRYSITTIHLKRCL